jgi:hypothetical protein
MDPGNLPPRPEPAPSNLAALECVQELRSGRGPRTKGPEALSRAAQRNGGTAQLMEDLLDGDPLELRVRGVHRLAAQSRVLHPHFLWRQSAARVAFRVRAGGPPRAGRAAAFLERCIGEAIADLLAAYTDQELAGDPLDPHDAIEFGMMGELLGLPMEHWRIATLTQNRLEPGVRRVAFEVLVNGARLEALSQKGLGNPVKLREQLRRALEAFAAVVPGQPPPATIEEQALSQAFWEDPR